VVVLGQDDSSLGHTAARAITSQHVAVASDPNNRGICCSDQYSFIERDIPAVKLDFDFPGESNKLMLDWVRERVHTPSDDAHQTLDLLAAGKYEDILWRLVLDVANAVHRPEWNPTSIYHQRYSRR